MYNIGNIVNNGVTLCMVTDGSHTMVSIMYVIIQSLIVVHLNPI